MFYINSIYGYVCMCVYMSIYIYIYIYAFTHIQRRRHEVIWRKNPLFVNFEMFQKSCMAVKYAIDEN